MIGLFPVTLAVLAAVPIEGAKAVGPDWTEKPRDRYEVLRMEEAGEEGGVANLPFARGRTFYSLDEYLAHLERQGAIDLPWWRQVAPGVYERVVRGFLGRQPERATRAELMRRFGFTR